MTAFSSRRGLLVGIGALLFPGFFLKGSNAMARRTLTGHSGNSIAVEEPPLDGPPPPPAAPPPKAAPAPAERIELPQLEIKTVRIQIIGDSPLICHRWSDKAKKQMLDKQMGKASQGKEKKSPEDDFRSSLYMIGKDKYGFPAVAFKSAAVDACTSLGKSITKVAVRQAFHIQGELVEISGEPVMREDMVRVGQGVADIRYRAEFKEWSCYLTIRYNSRALTAEQILNLINTAGFAVGVGEWRPEKNGQNGLFHVA